jgi:hypothetical protein
LSSVHTRDMGHEFEIVDHLLVFLGRVLLQLLEFLNKHINVSFELSPVHIRLTLYFILKLRESEGILKLVKAKFISVIVVHSGLSSE